MHVIVTSLSLLDKLEKIIVLSWFPACSISFCGVFILWQRLCVIRMPVMALQKSNNG